MNFDGSQTALLTQGNDWISFNGKYTPESFECNHIDGDTVDYPKTISRFWIPITEMKELYKFNLRFRSNVDILCEKKGITAWKKSRGDGNCYFRAVITRFFEMIHKVYSPVENLKFFKKLVKGLDPSKFDRNFLPAKIAVLAYLKEAISNKKKNQHIGVFMKCLENLQNSEFDLNLIKIARLITVHKLEMEKSSDDIFPFLMDENYENVIQDILTMGKEGGELTLLLLPMSLKVQVIQYMYLDSDIAIQAFPYSTPNGTPQICIVRRSGHYDILCSNQERELDMFDYDGNFNLSTLETYYAEMKEIISKNLNEYQS